MSRRVQGGVGPQAHEAGASCRIDVSPLAVIA